MVEGSDCDASPPGDLQIGVLYVLEVADRAGVAHSIAAVFSHRGLSMEALVAETARKPPRILVVFRGTPRQCRIVEQVLPRLHNVMAVQTLSLDSPALRAVALCRPLGTLPQLAGVDLHAQGETSLLSGSYHDVDRAIVQLTALGLVTEVSRSLLVL